MNSGCVLYVVNDPAFFVSHRLSLACALKKEGREVHVATGPGKKGAIKKINDSGLLYHQIPMSRSGRNPFKEIFCVISLWWLMVKIRPSLVHLVTIKAVLYGGIAARLSKVPSVVFAISGLGSSFVGSGKNMALLRKLLASLYRVSLGHANRKVIFQNPADRQALMTLCELSLEDTSLIPGSGVDLDEYPFLPEPEKDLTVTFAARLLKEKGVVEFVEAAKIVKSRGAQVQFLVIGEPDPGNPSSVSQDEVDEWVLESNVSVLGFRSDIAYLFSNSNIVVLPSYYGEGLPKTLVEAAACGRAVVTSDMPGCRDAILPDLSGLLVPARDAESLADAIEYLLQRPDVRGEMGRTGRVLAEEKYSIVSVIDSHLEIYKGLGLINL